MSAAVISRIRQPGQSTFNPDWGGRTDVLIVDTETTGLDERAEVVEVAVLDTTGAVRMDSVVMPVSSIPPAASNVHGLTREKLRLMAAPSFADVYPELSQMLKDASVVLAYNSDYDQRILKQSAVRHGLEMPQVNWQCVMKHYAQLRRLAQWVKLDAAARTEGVQSTKPAHRALSDCRTTLKLLQRVWHLSTS